MAAKKKAKRKTKRRATARRPGPIRVGKDGLLTRDYDFTSTWPSIPPEVINRGTPAIVAFLEEHRRRHKR